MSLIVFPEALSTSVIVFLLMASAVTSMITATLGAGGGVLLLVLMASWLPPAAIIPVHGMIQLGSNSGRAVLTRHHIDWKVIAAFAPGVLAGAGSYFQDGTWCHKDVTQFFQNGGFVVFAGLGVRQGGVHLSSPSSGWHTACCVVGDDWFYQSVAFKGKLRDVLCLTNL